MVRRKNKTKKSKRTTSGFQPIYTTTQLPINTIVTSGANGEWDVGDGSAFYRASSLVVRAAASTPSNLRFVAVSRSDPTTQEWVQVWSSATSVIGTNSQLIRIRTPRMLDPNLYQGWRAVTSGSITMAGWCNFTKFDP